MKQCIHKKWEKECIHCWHRDQEYEYPTPGTTEEYEELLGDMEDDIKVDIL